MKRLGVSGVFKALCKTVPALVCLQSQRTGYRESENGNWEQDEGSSKQHHGPGE